MFLGEFKLLMWSCIDSTGPEFWWPPPVLRGSEVVLVRPLVVDGSENKLEVGDDVGEEAIVENWLVTIFLVVVVTRLCDFVTIFATISETVFEVDVSATKFDICLLYTSDAADE